MKLKLILGAVLVAVGMSSCTTVEVQPTRTVHRHTPTHVHTSVSTTPESFDHVEGIR